MTTDPRESGPSAAAPRGSRRTRFLMTAVLIVLSWLAIGAGAMLVAGGRDALVLMPRSGLAAAAPDGTSLLSAGRGWVILRAPDGRDPRGFVRALYGAGARLVLPGSAETCLDFLQ